MSPTPTPWRVTKASGNIRAKDGLLIASCQHSNAKANAELIIMAVNRYSPLMEIANSALTNASLSEDAMQLLAELSKGIGTCADSKGANT